MNNVLSDSIEYLKTTDFYSWKLFTHASVTELSIPDTAKGIKNFVLNVHNPILSSNKKLRLIAFPILKKYPEIFDPVIFEPFLDYFLDEKECLIALRKFLKSKYELSNTELAKYSSCGIFACTIEKTHLENQKRLETILNIVNARIHGFDVYMNEDKMQPVNNVLIKKIGTTLKKELVTK